MAKHYTIGLRVDEETQARYRAAAGARTISEWARGVLDREAGRLEDERLGRALALSSPDPLADTVVLVKDLAGKWVERRIRLGGKA